MNISDANAIQINIAEVILICLLRHQIVIVKEGTYNVKDHYTKCCRGMLRRKVVQEAGNYRDCGSD